MGLHRTAMDTGVVLARESVSKLVDCHAHDTVSAMSYRDRSFIQVIGACAAVIHEAAEIIRNILVPDPKVHLAVPVTLVTVERFAGEYSIKAVEVVSLNGIFFEENAFPAIFPSVFEATVVVHIITEEGKGIGGGGKEGKC